LKVYPLMYIFIQKRNINSYVHAHNIVHG
jgi:hypothetical protein